MNPVSKFTPRTCREKVKSSNSDTSDKSKDLVQVFCRLSPIRDSQKESCVKLLSEKTLALTTPADFKNSGEKLQYMWIAPITMKLCRMIPYVSECVNPKAFLGGKEIHCTFKHIFTSYSTQNEVFDHVAYPLLEDVLKGKNGLLFTYGVTGSGKTYTLTGEPENPGLIPKCVNTIFNTIADHQAPKFTIKSDRMNGFEIQSGDEVLRDKMSQLKKPQGRTPVRIKKPFKDISYINDDIKIIDIDESCLYSVFVSYIEIYNNTVYDLLDDNEGNSKGVPSKILREDLHKNMYVNGVVELEVKSAEEAFQIFNTGRNRKRMGNTLLNSMSSRSHSIFNIRVVQFQQISQNSEGQPTVPQDNLCKIGQLSLVDLAGSERTNRTQNTGLLLKETSLINNSLMTLRSCIEILRENQLTGANRKVPYRDSRLTLLFRNYFEGDGRIQMIVCVNPSVDDFNENLQVMRFAETTKDVKVTRSEVRFTPHHNHLQKKTVTPGVCPKRAPSSFSFHPKLPEINLNFQNQEEASTGYEKLEGILRTRINNQHNFFKDLGMRKQHFRKRLLDFHQHNVLVGADLKSTKILLRKEKSKNNFLEQKHADAETAYSSLAQKNEDLHEKVKQLSNALNEKDLVINRKVLENEKTKQKIMLENEKRDHELDEKLRRQREQLQAAMRDKDTKLQKVRELLDENIKPEEVVVEDKPEDVIAEDEVNSPMPVQSLSHTQSQYRRIDVTQNVRFNRSRSVVEKWLEHNSVKPVPLKTVLQPSMKKRKSVTKLTKAADVINPKQSKYCLIAQEQDTNGEVETKVYKGDILSTCGGGAQVIFKDVEKLSQHSLSK